MGANTLECNATKLIVEKLHHNKLLNVRPESLNYLNRNKILYTAGLYSDEIRATSEWIEQSRRRKEQLKALKDLFEVSEKLDVDLLAFKTFRPFEYVPDDVDIIIMNDSELNSLVSVLLKNGFFIRSKGTPEVTLRKLVNGTFVDFDMHTRIAAGHYEYIDKWKLWKRRRFIEKDGIKIAVPNAADEMLIFAAHDIMKEFKITLATILHVLTLRKDIVSEAYKRSSVFGLSCAFRYLIKISSIFDNYLSDLPLKVPLPIVVSSYVENMQYRLKSQGLRPVKELSLFPSSKGIAALIRYVGL